MLESPFCVRSAMVFSFDTGVIGRNVVCFWQMQILLCSNSEHIGLWVSKWVHIVSSSSVASVTKLSGYLPSSSDWWPPGTQLAQLNIIKMHNQLHSNHTNTFIMLLTYIICLTYLWEADKSLACCLKSLRILKYPYDDFQLLISSTNYSVTVECKHLAMQISRLE